MRLPYKSITNVKIERNLDDKILKTAKLIIEFKKEPGIDAPIQMLAKPIIIENIENFEEMISFLNEKIEKSKNPQKVEETTTYTKEKDSIFYQ